MESSQSIIHAKELLFLLGIILATGMISGFVARMLKVPDVVLFLLAGMALGGLSIVIGDVSHH